MKRVSFAIIMLLCYFGSQSNAGAQYRETVWLQLNRDIFISGEDIEFTVSLLEADSYKASILSRNVRIELLDSLGNSLVRQNIELTDSRASGSISIPLNLGSGCYSLRAYTNWMRNFDRSGFSYYHLRILKPSDTEKDSLLDNDRVLRLEIHPYREQAVQGTLRCSIHTTNSSGDGISARGLVLSGPGDTVLTFNTNNTGWCTSFYHPADPGSYQVFALGYEKENISLKIPAGKEYHAEAIFSESNAYLNIELPDLKKGDTYRVLVHKMYSWSWFEEITAEDNSLSVRIPVKDLPGGISQVTVLDKNNNIIFKRLWSDYKEEAAGIMIMEEASARQEDQVKEFRYLGSANFDSSGVNSLYVLADRLIGSSTINNYLPGLPGWPATYSIPSAQDAFDGWISSNHYPDDIVSSFFGHDSLFPSCDTGNPLSDYPPETRGGILKGRVFRKDDNQALTNKHLALTILNDNSFYAAKTDVNGEFVLAFPGQSGQRDYLINFIEEYDPSWQLEFTDEYDKHTYVNNKRQLSFNPEELVFLRDQKLNLELEKLYYGEKEIATNRTDSLPRQADFYGRADISVLVDDYVKLTNLRELIYEVVPYVNIKTRNRKYLITVSGDYIFSSEYPTLILFDGIPVNEYQDLLNLPPDRIRQIEAIRTFYIHGNVIFEGIVNIRSVNSDFGGISLPSSTILSTLSLPVIKEYYPRGLSRRTIKGLPVLDHILKWDTLKEPSGSGIELYLNDMPGRYSIHIYGFDRDGKWHSGSLPFSIRATR